MSTDEYPTAELNGLIERISGKNITILTTQVGLKEIKVTLPVSKRYLIMDAVNLIQKHVTVIVNRKGEIKRIIKRG